MGKKHIAISILLMLAMDSSLLAMACCSFQPTPITSINRATTTLQFAPNGCLVTGDGAGNINSYSPVSPGSPCLYNTVPSYTNNTGSAVNDLSISNIGCLAVASSSQLGVYQPDGSCNSCSFLSSGPTAPSSTATTFAASECLVSGDALGNINIYSPTTPNGCDYDLTAPTQTFNIGASVTSIAFSPTNNCLVIGDASGNANIYAQISGCTYNPIAVQIITLPGAINDISFSSAGCLAISDDSNQVTIYQPGANCSYTLSTAPITDIISPAVIAFSPAGTCLVVGDNAGNLNVYNQVSGCTYSTTGIPVFSPPTGSPITSVAFSANGCLATGSGSVTNIYGPSAPLEVSVAPLFSTVCSGGTVVITATATGGNIPYTYNWTGPDGFTATGPTITITPAMQANAGIYTVIVTDASGCNATAIAFVGVTTVTAALSVAPDEICAGETATLTANIMGGTPPYTATFSDGTIITGITSNSVMHTVSPTVTTDYNVTITDSSLPTPCSDTSNTVTVTVDVVSTPIVLTAGTNCNGIITITGTADPGDIIEVFNGVNQIAVPVIVANDGSFSITTIPLPAGTYSTLTVVALNSTGCTASATVPPVTVNPSLGVNIVGPSIVCARDTLTLMAIANGGLPPYVDYSWTGPNGFSQSGPSDTINILNASLLNEGIYNVTVTDSFGCTASASMFVQVVSIGVALSVSPPFLCGGVGDSTLTGSIALGTPPYTAEIFADNVLIDTITDITTNTFTDTVMPTVTTVYMTIVTDSNGCTATSNPVVVTVSQVNVLTITSAVANCNGTVTIMGMSDPGNMIAIFNDTLGTQVGGPAIVPQSGMFSITTTPVAVGGMYVFSAVATNPFGCTATAVTDAIQVNAPIHVTIAPSSQTICPGNTGTLTAIGTGGTGIYTYQWSGPDGFSATGNPITVTPTGAINSGTYFVVITDTDGCQAVASASILVTAVTLSALGTVCSGTSPLLTITVADTNPPYTTDIFINGGFFQTITNSNNVFTFTPPPITVPTTYFVRVTDAAGCTVQSNPVTITASIVTAPSITSTTVNCDGTVTIIGSSDPGDTITILLAGTNVSIPVTVAPDGTFTVTTEPLAPGTNIVLTITATNSFCCPASVDTIVTILDPLELTLAAPSICSGATLNITSTVTGGTGPGTYTYLWAGPDGFSSTSPNVSIPNATLANAGLYTLMVTDAADCTVTESIFAQVTNVAITLSADPTSLCAGEPSILTATVVGGLAPYTVQFSGFPPRAPSDDLVYTQQVFPVLGDNIFTATVTDAAGCSATSNEVVFDLAPVTPPVIATVTVNCLGEVTITGTATPGNVITVSINGTDISIPVTVDDLGNFSVTTEPIAPGSYTLTVTAANSFCCSAASTTETVTINDPLLLTLAAPAICSGATLNITSTVTGGLAPYTYTWTGPDGFSSTSPNVSIPNATLANSGLYTLVVTDAAGCRVTQSIFAQVTNVAITLSADPTFLCAGEPSILTATVVGGLAPYTVQFSGFPPRAPSNDLVYTQQVFPVLGDNTFTATVTDAAGCSSTSNEVVFDLAPLVAPTITSITPDCSGQVLISGTADPGDVITVLINGVGVSIPVTADSEGNFTLITQILAPGTYPLTITATNSLCCSASTMGEVTILDPLLLTLAAPSICSGATLNITSTVTGGLAPYTYAWTGPNGFSSTSPNVSIPNATLANAGLYTLIVTDANGCTVTESIFAQVTNVAITLSADPTFLCAGDPSILTATVVGGLAPYTVQFSGFPPRAPSNDLVYTQEVFPILADNTFTATVIDANGCTATSNVIVFELAPVTPPVIISTTVDCLGQVIIMGTATPGTTITVSLSGTDIAIPVIVDDTGHFTIITKPLAPGSYILTVTSTNAFGCSESTIIAASEANPTLDPVIVPDPLVVVLSAPLTCAGDTLTITSTVTGGTAPYTYEWTGPDGFESTDPIVSIPNATFANAGLYTLVVTSGDCVAEASIFAQVDNVGITLSAEPIPICSGESSILTATIASGLPPYVVTFSGFAPIVTNNTIVTQTVTPAVDTTYTATVVDSNECSAISNSVTFSFVPLTAPVITSVINNSSGQVTITGTSTPGTLINVFLNGIPIAIPVFVQPDGTFMITTMCLGRGNYTFDIEAMSSTCCIASTSVTTFVDCAPTIITLTNPACSATCRARPTITGTTSPNTAIIIFANGIEIGRTASNALGEFTFVPEEPLANGSYIIMATTIPGACNCPEGDSNSIRIVVDSMIRNCLSLAIRNKYCSPCLVL